MFNLFIQKAYAQVYSMAIPIVNYGPTREQLFQNIISTLLIVLGVISLIVIIYSGYSYMTSAGNPDQATRAKNILLGAIIGLVIAMASYVIINEIIMGKVF
jgi:heme/copper-type cytochrome/quinol oxidase subunit 2